MTKEKILALLLAKFPAERKEGLEHLALSLALVVTDEEQANELVDRMTAEAVSNRIKDWRKAVDAETSKAVETYKKNHPAHEPEPPKQDPPKQDPPKQDPPQGLTAEAVAKIVSEAVAKATQPLQSELDAIKGKSVQNERQTLIEAELNGMPDTLKKMVLDGFNGRQFESQDAFDSYLSSTKEQVKGFKQEMADRGLKNFGAPAAPKAEPEKVSQGTEAYIKAKSEQKPQGKEL